MENLISVECEWLAFVDIVSVECHRHDSLARIESGDRGFECECLFLPSQEILRFDTYIQGFFREIQRDRRIAE